MGMNFTILVSDRNRNVREFLRREMESEGYLVRSAKSAGEILAWVTCDAPIDLVILDPDLPGSVEASLAKKIADRVPLLPVVVHSFSSDYIKQYEFLNNVSYVEKEGSSIEDLKKIVAELLHGPKKTKNNGSKG